VPDFFRGIDLAREVIHTGKAMAKLEALIAKSKSFSNEV